MISRAALVTLSVILFASSATSSVHASSPATLVACIEKSHRTLTDLTAGFEQKSTLASLGRSERGKGRVAMKFGGGKSRFRFDYDKPRQTIVTDGTTLWYHQPSLGQVVRTPLERFLSGEKSLALSYLGGLRNVSADFTAKGGGRDQKGNPRLILVPKRPNPLLSRLELTLSEEVCRRIETGGEVGFPILSSVIVDQGGNRTEMTYHGPVVNQGVPDGRFTFVPPAGTTVIDQ